MLKLILITYRILIFCKFTFQTSKYTDGTPCEVKISCRVWSGGKVGEHKCSNSYLSLLYGFRGSQPEYIRDFLFSYNNAERLYLNTNYRCRHNILYPFAQGIKNNQVRVEKEMQAFKDGGVLNLRPYKHNLKEIISDLVQAEEHYESEDLNIGVLVRVNSQRTIIADLLADEGVIVDMSSMDYSLRKNKIYKNILGAIYAIKDENNQDFAKFCKPLFASLNYKIFKVYERELDLNWYKEIIERNIYRLPEETINIVKKIKSSNNVYNLVGYIFKLSLPYYEALAKKGYGSLENTQEIFKYLFSISKGQSLAEFEKNELRKESLLKLYCGSGLGLKITTMHSVKGLEYDKVFLVGVNNNVFPSNGRISKLEKEGKYEEIAEYIEEERRLFYVGGTRAINELTIMYQEGKESLFIHELLNEDGVPLIDLVEPLPEN